MQTEELAQFYAKAQLGRLVNPGTSKCFTEYMGHGGLGPFGKCGFIQDGGMKNGIEADIRSMGLLLQTDRGPLALSISGTHLPDGDRGYEEMQAAARAVMLHLYGRLGAPKAQGAM